MTVAIVVYKGLIPVVGRILTFLVSSLLFFEVLHSIVSSKPDGMRTWSEMLNSVAFLRDLWKSHKNPIFLRFELPFVSRVRFLFFIPMGNTEFLSFFHFFDFIRSCVQNYFFTPEIGIVKQLKNNEVWYIFMAFSKALKKATELAKSNFTNM